MNRTNQKRPFAADYTYTVEDNIIASHGRDKVRLAVRATTLSGRRISSGFRPLIRRNGPIFWSFTENFTD